MGSSTDWTRLNLSFSKCLLTLSSCRTVKIHVEGSVFVRKMLVKSRRQTTFRLLLVPVFRRKHEYFDIHPALQGVVTKQNCCNFLYFFVLFFGGYCKVDGSWYKKVWYLWFPFGKSTVFHPWQKEDTRIIT